MSTLPDRLAELAQDAPPGGGVPGLWDRGRRIARVRRLGTVVITVVACLALVVVGVLGWDHGRASSVQPVAPGSAPAIPTEIYQPSRWLPGTAGHPIGPLAVVLQAPRGRNGSGLVGVSATTGEYRFLDLPDVAAATAGSSVSLAPDGRYLAYWTGGKPSGTPWAGKGAVVVGVAVYDTVTGRALQHPLRTEHGLNPISLTWVDGDRLAVQVAQYVGAVSADGVQTVQDNPAIWNLSDSSFTTLSVSSARLTGSRDQMFSNNHVLNRVPAGVVKVVSSTGSGELLIQGTADTPEKSSQSALLIDPGVPGDTGLPVSMPNRDRSGGIAVDPAGRMAAVWGHARGLRLSGESVSVATRTRTGDVRLAPVPGTTGFGSDVLAWVDDRRVAVVRIPADDSLPGAVDVLDVVTGQAGPVTSWPETLGVLTPWFATDLLARDSVARPAPPNPEGPPGRTSHWDRPVSWSLVGIVIMAGAALVVWRRRVRA